MHPGAGPRQASPPLAKQSAVRAVASADAAPDAQAWRPLPPRCAVYGCARGQRAGASLTRLEPCRPPVSSRAGECAFPGAGHGSNAGAGVASAGSRPVPCGPCLPLRPHALRTSHSRTPSPIRFSGRGAPASRPCAQRPQPCGRAWPRAWLLSRVCGHVSARLWRCARAAWRHPPAGGPARAVRRRNSVRLFSSSGARQAKGERVSHKARRVSTLGSYPQNLCITMWTETARPSKRRCFARACVMVSAFSPAALLERDESCAPHSPPALNMVAVTRLRPECLLR